MVNMLILFQTGRLLLALEVQNSADSLFSVMFDSASFQEQIVAKTEQGVEKFQMTPWVPVNGVMIKKVNYEFTKSIAWSSYQITVNQVKIFVNLPIVVS
jgi:hypothetical protein